MQRVGYFLFGYKKFQLHRKDTLLCTFWPTLRSTGGIGQTHLLGEREDRPADFLAQWLLLTWPIISSTCASRNFQGCDFLSRELIRSSKQLLRPLRQNIRKFRGKILFRFLKYCCILFRPKVVLTYLNTSKADGVGAQIQRILAIRSLSANLQLGYLHTEINSLAIHPLDSYQNRDEMNAFLLKLNHEFWIQNSEEYLVENLHERQTNTLSFSFLFLCIFKSKFSKRLTLVKLVEPYSVSEYDPHKYEGILSRSLVCSASLTLVASSPCTKLPLFSIKKREKMAPSSTPGTCAMTCSSEKRTKVKECSNVISPHTGRLMMPKQKEIGSQSCPSWPRHFTVRVHASNVGSLCRSFGFMLSNMRKGSDFSREMINIWP